MYHIGKDVRQQKTADLLLESAHSLVREGDVSSLTISGICARAGVARSTFYRLFDSVDDLIQLKIDTLFDELLTNYIAKRDAGMVTDPIDDYYDLFLAHATEVRGLTGQKKLGLLLNGHKEALTRHAAELFPDMDPASEEFLYFVEIRSGAILGAFTAWTKNGCRTSRENLHCYLEQQLIFYS